MTKSFNNSEIPVAKSEHLLTEAELHKLLVEWNNTQSDYPNDKCIHELFEATVERAPKSVALVFEGKQLTYKELNARANQLAHYLQSLGVEPEVLVGICIERSLEMIVGLLAILKAGGTYVPLDLTYPFERLAFMAEDASVQILLTKMQFIEKLPQHLQRIICLDSDWSEIAQYREENPYSEVTPNNLAYVMYTSGSTGKPKGVSIMHRGVVRLVKATNYANFGAEEIFLQLAPISFDASTFEIWGSLLNGGLLVVMPPHKPSLQELGQALIQYKITTLWLTAGLFHLMVDEQLESLKNVRQLLAGGDVLSVPHVKKALQELKGCTLINGYGPTENTTFTCCYTITDFNHVEDYVPIGRPIANTQVYLLDEKLQPVTVGVLGELYIGGDGLARGYLNRPDLTNEKFIPNPFSNLSDGHLYKTGDLARYNRDGNIEFLGRIDNQVKIRGFRIELGEIEAVLRQHPNVLDAVVTVCSDIPDDKRLVAYVVGNTENLATLAQKELEGYVVQKLIPHIRSFLQGKLPDYMVPSYFVLLDALPLTPNGKVDRLTLPAPDIKRLERLENFVAPRTTIEKVLVRIWNEVLGLGQIGIHDNFLELGGQSLLAVQIISRLYDTLQVKLSVDSLFASLTIAKLATSIEAVDWENKKNFASSIQRVSRNQNLPLSWGQEQLWFLAQLQPDTPVYNEPFTIRLGGAIDVTALEKALNKIIQRHESLRSRFITVDGQPVQVIDSPTTFNLAVVDLRQFPQDRRESEALRLATREAKQAFDLSSSSLLRATLMRLADEDYRLFLTFHHIIIDGVSLYSVFLPELATLYEAFSRAKPSPLTELPIQYADFTSWQRQWFTKEILQSQLNYWKQQLTDLSILQLPYDRPRRVKQTFRGARLCFALSKNLTEALKTLSQQEGVTLYMTLLAAFKTLLYRYTGQDDIVVGTVSAGRNRPEIEKLMGYFLNTLVLRTDLSGSPSFQQLLSRVRSVTLEAYAHEDLPYQKLVETLQPERNLSHNPLFQVAFVLEPPVPSLSVDWTISQLDIQTDTAKFDITLELDSRLEGIIGRLEYNTDLFDASTISRMIEHFRTLLSGIVTNPKAQISELPMLTEAERQQLLVEWNNTQTQYPQDKYIHQLFEEQVELTPDAIAVVFEGEQLTYRELNAKANQLAHYLQAIGVEPEVLVGICVERSLEMVVGLLGILKAGGAYVPLDPEYPSKRLAFMLKDSKVQVLLTQTQLMEKLPQCSERIICLDSDWEEVAQHSEENPYSKTAFNNLAYLIYTSGSTGKPKGVAIMHRGVVRLVKATNYANFGAEEIFLQLAPISFDASTFEIWGSLLNGGLLVIMPSHKPSLQELGQALVQYQITTLWLTAGLFHLMVDEQLESLKNVRQLLAGGDVLSVPHVKKALQELKGCTLINGYGPTENTTFTCCYTITDFNHVEDNVPVGRPIANTQAYVLDKKLQPVPIGVSGELYIGGDGLARGYLNLPDLTAEKFIPNPFNQKSGSRLYKTGDLVRYLPDGNIEFLGRIDNQVKIRGFRIELGEIESLLAKHSAVKETVVIVRENIVGSKQLIAYIVPNKELANIISDLRDFLKEQLPDYMVPSAFVTLNALPLTPNGKVDRRALPAPKYQPELELNFVAPRTPVEEILASIWASVLALKKVGIYNNFFELGGHSLLAVQIISRICEKFEINLPLSCLFQLPTIAALSQLIDSTLTINTQGYSFRKIPAVSPQARTQVIPLSFAQDYIWCLEHKFAGKCAANSSMALRLTGTLSRTVLERSLNEIIRRHEILRTTFPIVKEQPTQKIAPSFTLPFQFIDLQYLCSQMSKEAEAYRIFREAMNREFDLTVAPPIKTILIQLSEEEHWLLIAMHHIITDGWSCGILLQELEIIYSNFLVGKPSPLPELPLQYADFAIWQRKNFSEEVLSAHLPYWQQHLANFPTSLDLFPAIQSTPDRSFANEYHFSLPVSLTNNIASLSHACSVTPFIVLLTALNILLHKWSKQTDILVVGTIANRSILEIERLLGCFISDLPLGIQLNCNQTAISLLGQVRKTVTEGLTYAIPSEKIWEPVENKLKILRTVTFVLVPAKNWLGQILKCEELTISSDRGLWSEQDVPLELYADYPNETTQAIKFHACYSTTTFTAEMIERFLKSYEVIIEQLVRYPETIISDFVLIE